MSEPMDDELRAMLEARAGRVPTASEREVLAAVRDAIRAPGGGAGIGFGMLPVRAGHGSGAVAGWTAIGVIAVIVLAIAGTNLGGGLRSSNAGSTAGTTEAPGAPSASALPAASTPATPAPNDAMLRELRLDDVRLALARGTLNGSVIVITGVIREATEPCRGGAGTRCTRYSISGLDGVVVTWTNRIWTSAFDQGPGATPLGTEPQPLVVVAEGGQLQLLGRLPGELASPLVLATFMNRRSMIGNDPFVLVPVAGWLVVGGTHSCPLEAPGSTPCPGPGPTLTGTAPFPDGLMSSDAQLQVAIAPGAPGIEPGQIVTAGPFLLRPSIETACTDGSVLQPAPACRGGIGQGWEVVARYDPRLVYRIVP
jgi:hypothetical protein